MTTAREAFGNAQMANYQYTEWHVTFSGKTQSVYATKAAAQAAARILKASGVNQKSVKVVGY